MSPPLLKREVFNRDPLLEPAQNFLGGPKKFKGTQKGKLTAWNANGELREFLEGLKPQVKTIASMGLRKDLFTPSKIAKGEIR